MPIDYLGQRDQTQQGILDLINSRNPDDELANTANGIENDRNKLFSSVAQNYSGVTPTITQSLASKTPVLARNQNAILAKQKQSLQAQKYNQVFNAIMDKAKRAGMDYQSAQEYARQYAAQTQEQDFQAAQEAEKRAQQVRLSGIRQEYANKGIALQNEYSPVLKPDYAGAFTRVALGTAVGLGTSAYLKNRTGSSQPQFSASPSASPTPYGPQPLMYGPRNPYNMDNSSFYSGE